MSWYPGNTVPDLAGRDLCGGGNYPDQARHAEPSEKRSLSDEALGLVNGPRAEKYGEPVAHMNRVAASWRAKFGWNVTARTAALALADLKMVREAYRHDHDNAVDAEGYLAIAERCAEAEPDSMWVDLGLVNRK